MKCFARDFVRLKTFFNKMKKAEAACNNGNDELVGISPRSSSGKMLFSVEKKTRFCNNIMACSEFGFPCDILDLRMIVKHYLESIGWSV